jgi:hypothetical protein
MAVRWTRRGILKAGVAAGVAAGAASVPFLTVKYGSAGRNIILIVVDCLRADRIGAFRTIDGVAKSLTPNIDALAAGGLKFLNAKSPSTFTPASMLSFMYDTPPTSVLYTGFGTAVAGPQRNMAARVKDAGYVALFGCSNEVLQMGSIRDDFDQRAFLAPNDTSRDLESKERAGGLWPEIYGHKLNARVSSLLGQNRKRIADKPLYLQVHYMDCHEPYNATGFATSIPMDDRIFPKKVNECIRKKLDYCPGKRMTVEQGLAYLSERYDSAVHAVDKSIGELLAELKERHILDDALVIVTADHGEEFADNAEIERKHVGHSGPMDDPLIHVPFVARATGHTTYGTAGTTVAAHASTVRTFNDLVIDYATLAPGQYSQLRSALDAGAYPEHAVMSSLNWYNTKTNESACTLRRKDGYVKYRVFYKDDGSVSGERLYAYGPDGKLTRAKMAEEVKNGATAALRERPKASVLDKESEEKLKSLGYIDPSN